MRVAVATDHGGFPVKAVVIDTVQKLGHEVLDCGTYNLERVDFPDFVVKAGRAIQNGEAERAILICGSGVGVCIAANKMKGVYAAITHDTYSAHQGVEHDNMNTLCLGGRVIGPEPVKEIVEAFLSAKFEGTGNYLRRVNKILDMERND
jgi:ribose 5-phosphate isomerase B